MSITTSDPDQGLEMLVSVLGRPEVQGSLATALEKLPDMLEKYAAVEGLLGFAAEMVKDRESMRYLYEGFKADLPPVTLNRETLEAGLLLLDKLPKLVKYVGLAEQLIDTAESVLTDKESVQYLVDGAMEWLGPVVSTVSDGKSAVHEARERANKDTSAVSVFTLLKIVKDPAMQRGIHFLQALLAIMEERRASAAR